MEPIFLYDDFSRFVFIKTSQASVLLPVATGWLYYKSLNKQFRVLLFFFILSIGFEIQASVFKKIYENNMPGLHLFTVIEFLVFSYIFYLCYAKQHFIAKFINTNAIIFTAIAISEGFIINSIWEQNVVSRSYASISIVCYSLFFFYYFFKDNYKYYSWESPLFWFSIGTLVYFSLNLFYFMLSKYLIINAKQTATLSLLTHGTINIISNTIYARSFLCFRKRVMTL